MPFGRLYQTELVESFRLTAALASPRRWDAAVVRCADDGENDAAVERVGDDDKVLRARGSLPARVVVTASARPQPEFVIPDAAYLGAPAPPLSSPRRWPRVASTGAQQWQGCHAAWLSPVAPLSSSLSAAVALLLVGGRWARSSCGVYFIGFF
uniref:Uncharacterized protein n=1 Tax=Oryza barthii TaxID=65489 RepID=A0A0D3ET67_9ORYZ